MLTIVSSAPTKVSKVSGLTRLAIVAPNGAARTPPISKPSVAVVKITTIQGAPDSKAIVQVVAAHTRWTPPDLTAPAGKVWHVKIDDQDPDQHHNFTVASGRTFEEWIYQVTNFVKGRYTFDIPALPAGTYLFICTLHPESMTGKLTLE